MATTTEHKRIGFTGSRAGMTAAQTLAFCGILHRFRPEEFHHGACRGSDADAVHALSLHSWVYTIIAWPGVSATGGKNDDRDDKAIELSGIVKPEMTHFARNREIVKACDLLVASPAYAEPITPETKGGTAYTVNYARRVGKPVIVIRPDGSTEE